MDDLLMHAVRAGQVTTVRFLALLGADVNLKHTDHKGRSYGCLHLAASQLGPHGPRMCEALLDHGADIEATDSDGRTPLTCAVALMDTDDQVGGKMAPFCNNPRACRTIPRAWWNMHRVDEWQSLSSDRF